MRKKFKTQTKQVFYRLNYRITAPTLRVIDNQDKQLGVMPLREALEKARASNLDLVEIAPKAEPPVAKIIDFQKFLYMESKRLRAAKKNSKSGSIKEIWLRPFMAEHDFQSRIERGKELVAESGKLKVVVKFKGRQITRRDFGFEAARRFIAALDNAKVDKEPILIGRQIIATVSKK